VQQRCVCLRTLLHWARQAKVVKYERGEEARLAALAGRAAMDEQVFSLRAELAALMRDKEDTKFTLEHLRSTSQSVHSSDVQGERETERIEALEARLRQADEHIHQLVTHGGTQ
jgi:predicted RNase H-like nuclease (RuvC/YqgF family)